MLQTAMGRKLENILSIRNWSVANLLINDIRFLLQQLHLCVYFILKNLLWSIYLYRYLSCVEAFCASLAYCVIYYTTCIRFNIKTFRNRCEVLWFNSYNMIKILSRKPPFYQEFHHYKKIFARKLKFRNLNPYWITIHSLYITIYIINHAFRENNFRIYLLIPLHWYLSKT